MTYSSSLAMGRQRFSGSGNKNNQSLGVKSWAKNQNTTNFRAHENKLGPVSNTILLIVLACLLGLLYLTQITKTNAFGYRINSLQEEQTSLQYEHDELQVASARLQALERVENSKVAKGLVVVAPSGTLQN